MEVSCGHAISAMRRRKGADEKLWLYYSHSLHALVWAASHDALLPPNITADLFIIGGVSLCWQGFYAVDLARRGSARRTLELPADGRTSSHLGLLAALCLTQFGIVVVPVVR